MIINLFGNYVIPGRQTQPPAIPRICPPPLFRPISVGTKFHHEARDHFLLPVSLPLVLCTQVPHTGATNSLIYAYPEMVQAKGKDEIEMYFLEE